MTSNSVEHQENLGPPSLFLPPSAFCKHIRTHEASMSTLAQCACIWTPTPFTEIRLQIASRLCFCFFPDHIWKQTFILVVPPPQSFVMVRWSNLQQIFPSYRPTPIPTLFTEDKLFVSDLLLLKTKQNKTPATSVNGVCICHLVLHHRALLQGC